MESPQATPSLLFLRHVYRCQAPAVTRLRRCGLWPANSPGRVVLPGQAGHPGGGRPRRTLGVGEDVAHGEAISQPPPNHLGGKAFPGGSAVQSACAAAPRGPPGSGSWQPAPRALCHLSSLRAPGFRFKLSCVSTLRGFGNEDGSLPKGAQPPVWGGVRHRTRYPEMRQNRRGRRAGLQGENAVEPGASGGRGDRCALYLEGWRVLMGGGPARARGIARRHRHGVSRDLCQARMLGTGIKGEETTKSGSLGSCLQSPSENSRTGAMPVGGVNGARRSRHRLRASSANKAAFVRGHRVRSAGADFPWAAASRCFRAAHAWRCKRRGRRLFLCSFKRPCLFLNRGLCKTGM